MSVSEQTFPAEGIERVSLELERRGVSVEWVESDEITVQGEAVAAEPAAGELFVGGAGAPHGVRISVGQIAFVAQGGGSGATVRLRLPRTLPTFRLRVRQGDVRLSDARGQCDLRLDRGDLVMHGGQGQTTIAIGSGDLEVEEYDGPLSITGGSGQKDLRQVVGKVSMTSGSGDVELLGGRGDLAITTGSGDIDLTDRDCDEVAINAGSGDITLKRGSVGSLAIVTGAGDVDCDCALGLHEHAIESGSGDIELSVPRDISARIEATTHRGRIDSEIPLVEVGQRGKRSLFGRRLVGSIGEGAERAEISLRSGSGDITLRWLQPQPRSRPQPQPQPQPQPPAAPPRPADLAMPLGPPAAPEAHVAPETPEAAGAPEPPRTSGEGAAQPGAEGRRRVLEALAAGSITPAEAARLLDALDRAGLNTASNTRGDGDAGD
ncbi:MAG TPA: DUF4097 family beta strand repeat-containing protein [Thermomicrobiaceae bacterium]|nr:DUF4097 family beta strand repeat-containing protein [Thermomicrobiaceae bacterium]